MRVRSAGEAEVDFGRMFHVSLPPRGSCGLFASSIIRMSPSRRLTSASGFTLAEEPANSNRNLVRENSWTIGATRVRTTVGDVTGNCKEEKTDSLRGKVTSLFKHHTINICVLWTYTFWTFVLHDSEWLASRSGSCTAGTQCSLQEDGWVTWQGSVGVRVSFTLRQLSR